MKDPYENICELLKTQAAKKQTYVNEVLWGSGGGSVLSLLF
jgi:hypothetical protein